MRPEENPLDLNNFPDDHCTRDGNQVLEDGSSSAGYRRRKSGAEDGKDESGKVYECRFCSLKFCKSQALGGHMNRHRQERETETLNWARHVVLSNNNLVVQGPHNHHHLGGQPIPQGGYHQTGNMADSTMPFRSVQPPRFFPGAATPHFPPPPQQQYIYTSPPRVVSYPSQYPPHQMNEYLVGHVLPSNGTQHPCYVAAPPQGTNYTCIGAPVGSSMALSGGGGGGRDVSLNHQDEGLNWARGYIGRQQHLDPSLINRFQDGL